MSFKIVLSVLLACGLSVSAGAADDAADRALLKQCESTKGEGKEVKEECRKVAKKMIKNDQAVTERDDQTSQDITHSSPAMTTPEETEREAASKKRSSAGQKDAAAAQPAKPDPEK